MKSKVSVLAMLFAACLWMPQFAAAVSWSPVAVEHEEKIAKGIMEKGTIVCLFQSGTADVKKTIKPDDMLIVYRENPQHELKEVGKIRVLSYAGEDYLKGEVVEGEIRPGDVAKKGEAASLVISPADKCK